MSATLFATGTEYTVKNLLAAYQGEINARARYLAFATRAESEGLQGIASLFRAAARAEQIHANNQARVLRQLGAAAKAEVYAYQVHHTLENLNAALAGEHFEIDVMYPAFIEEARISINTNAARWFEWSLEAEKGHAQLYREAIHLLELNAASSWIDQPRDFFICPVCASTSDTREADNCAICQYPSDRLETVR